MVNEDAVRELLDRAEPEVGAGVRSGYWLDELIRVGAVVADEGGSYTADDGVDFFEVAEELPAELAARVRLCMADMGLRGMSDAKLNAAYENYLGAGAYFRDHDPDRAVRCAARAVRAMTYASYDAESVEKEAGDLVSWALEYAGSDSAGYHPAREFLLSIAEMGQRLMGEPTMVVKDSVPAAATAVSWMWAALDRLFALDAARPPDSQAATPYRMLGWLLAAGVVPQGRAGQVRSWLGADGLEAAVVALERAASLEDGSYYRPDPNEPAERRTTNRHAVLTRLAEVHMRLDQPEKAAAALARRPADGDDEEVPLREHLMLVRIAATVDPGPGWRRAVLDALHAARTTDIGPYFTPSADLKDLLVHVERQARQAGDGEILAQVREVYVERRDDIADDVFGGTELLESSLHAAADRDVADLLDIALSTEEEYAAEPTFSEQVAVLVTRKVAASILGVATEVDEIAAYLRRAAERSVDLLERLERHGAAASVEASLLVPEVWAHLDELSGVVELAEVVQRGGETVDRILAGLEGREGRES